MSRLELSVPCDRDGTILPQLFENCARAYKKHAPKTDLNGLPVSCEKVHDVWHNSIGDVSEQRDCGGTTIRFADYVMNNEYLWHMDCIVHKSEVGDDDLSNFRSMRHKTNLA